MEKKEEENQKKYNEALARKENEIKKKMSSKNKGSSNKAISRTFFWNTKKDKYKKKNSPNYPKKKVFAEELDTSSQKENLPENIQNNETEIKYEDEYQGLVYHPQYTGIIPAGIIYFVETEKKEDYNNFKRKIKKNK